MQLKYLILIAYLLIIIPSDFAYVPFFISILFGIIDFPWGFIFSLLGITGCYILLRKNSLWGIGILFSSILVIIFQPDYRLKIYNFWLHIPLLIFLALSTILIIKAITAAKLKSTK